MPIGRVGAKRLLPEGPSILPACPDSSQLRVGFFDAGIGGMYDNAGITGLLATTDTRPRPLPTRERAGLCPRRGRSPDPERRRRSAMHKA